MISGNINQSHIAPTREMQPATFALNSATTHETSLQPIGLKILAYKVLARNSLRNLDAISQETSCNFESEKCSEKLHRDSHYSGFTLGQLEVYACGDWAEIKDDPIMLLSFANALSNTMLIKQGIAPSDYTKTVNCQYCGLVKLWTSCPDQILGCPWCLVTDKKISICK
jgi:hypothetical protein